jgi:hypothetical protein
MLTTGALMVGVWLQDPDSLSSGNSRLLMIFVGIVALAMLVQAIVVIVFVAGATKAYKRMLGIAEEAKVKAWPVIASAETLMRDAVPKVKIMTENLVETTHIVRAKVQEFDTTLTGVNDTIKDANQKTKVQVGRVDDFVTNTLSRTAALADTIHSSIRKPVSEVAGVVNGLKAGLDVLLSRAKGNGYRGGPGI